MEKKKYNRVLFAGYIFALVCLLCTFLHSRLPIAGDAISYMSLADSLAHFKGYAIDGVLHTKWPPVFPLVLAAAVFFLGTNIIVFKSIVIIAAVFSICLAYRVLSKVKEKDISLWAVMITGFSFPFIYHSVGIYSEMVYMSLSMAGLFLLNEYESSEKVFTPILLWSGLFVALAALTRTIGISLLPAGALFLILSKRQDVDFRIRIQKTILFSIIAMMPIGVWYLRNMIIQHGQLAPEYLAWITSADPYTIDKQNIGLMGVIGRFGKIFMGYMRIFAIPDMSLKFATGVNPYLMGISYAISSLWGLGYVWHAIKRRSIIEYYIIIYFGLLLFLNWYDIRYFVPILPFIMYYLLWTIKSSIKYIISYILKVKSEKLSLISSRIFIVIAAILLSINIVFSIFSGKASRLRSSEYDGIAKNYYDAVMWIKNKDKEAIVMSSGSQMVTFWTGLKAVSFPFNPDPSEIIKFMDKNSVDYVIKDNFQFVGKADKFLKPAIANNKSRFKKVNQFGNTIVYAVVNAEE